MYNRQVDKSRIPKKKKNPTSWKTAFTEQLYLQRNGEEDYDNAQ